MADETSCLVRLNRPKILVRNFRIWFEPRSGERDNFIILGTVGIVSEPIPETS